MATDFQDVFFRLFSFGQGTFEELVDAVAYHELVGGFLMGGVAQGLKGVVGALCQVGDGVQQGAVEVEYNQFFHLVSSFSFVFFCAKVVLREKADFLVWWLGNPACQGVMRNQSMSAHPPSLVLMAGRVQKVPILAPIHLPSLAWKGLPSFLKLFPLRL